MKPLSEKIKDRIKRHKSNFDRYDTETRVYVDDEQQVEYSTNQAIQEMHLNDEIKEISEDVEGSVDKLKKHFNCGSWTTEEIQFEIDKRFGEFK